MQETCVEEFIVKLPKEYIGFSGARIPKSYFYVF
jgi:hypothetical protein